MDQFKRHTHNQYSVKVSWKFLPVTGEAVCPKGIQICVQQDKLLINKVTVDMDIIKPY